jgi:hypothetical protein
MLTFLLKQILSLVWFLPRLTLIISGVNLKAKWLPVDPFEWDLGLSGSLKFWSFRSWGQIWLLWFDPYAWF